jgi:hypothetical protein
MTMVGLIAETISLLENGTYAILASGSPTFFSPAGERRKDRGAGGFMYNRKGELKGEDDFLI